MAKLSANFVDSVDVTEELVSELFVLFSQYYADVVLERFRSDLKDKDGLFILSDKENRIRGFSSLAINRHLIDGKPIRTIFSGDTIIEHQYWGQQSLAFAWLKQAGCIMAQAPDIPLYWFLIVKGARTYRYLSVFAKDFYPNHCKPTPDRIKKVMDHLATEKFNGNYDPRTGVITFPEPMGRLKKRWCETKLKESSSEDIVYFMDKNPGYGRGDELVCLAEISEENLQPLAARVFAKGRQ